MTMMIEGGAMKPAQPKGLLGRLFPGKKQEEEDWRRPIVVGIIGILVFLGGFLLWSIYAPLDSAVLSKGIVTVDKNRKTIQHFSGGIINEILVEEGSRVHKGQVLLRLDMTQTDSSLQMARTQYNSLLAQEARLIAERDNLDKIKFPQELLAQKDDEKIWEVMEGERKLFESRKKTGAGRVEILEQKIEQIKEEISALGAQKKSDQRQLELINQEVGSIKILVDKGLERQSRLLALQRHEALIQGSLGQNKAFRARAEQSIQETKLQIISMKDQAATQVANELNKVQANLAGLSERVRSAQDIYEKNEIRSPASGVVVGLNVHTVGGVIRGSEPLMDIVPDDEKLIVETRVKPVDIDLVHPGQKASLRFTAYNFKTTPLIEGKVVHVSADALPMPNGQGNYYLAKIEASPESLAEFKNIELYPGMPVDAMIVTGERTALEAILGPMWQIFDRAFREE